MKKLLIISLAVTIAVVGLSSPAHSKTFRNCAELRMVYKFGVAKAMPIRNAGPGQVETPRLSRAVYLANKRLDVDKDGLVCEVQKKLAKVVPPSAAPSVPGSPTFSESISLDNLDPKRTWLVASATVREAVKFFESSALGIRYVLGPSVSQELVARETKGIDRIAGLWSDYFLPQNNVRFIYVSPGDAESAAQITEREQISSMFPTGSSLRSKIETNNCGFAAAAIIRGLYTNVQCLNSNTKGIWSAQTGPHEYTHFVQFHSAMMPTSAACWVTEGMATFYGMSVGWWEADPRGLERSGFFKNFAQAYKPSTSASNGLETLASILKAGDPQEFAKVMRQLEPVDCGSSKGSTTVQIGYLLGGMAFEALVASKGHESVLKYLRDFAITKNWKISFENAFGLSVEDFYVKLAPYAAKSINW